MHRKKQNIQYHVNWQYWFIFEERRKDSHIITVASSITWRFCEPSADTQKMGQLLCQ